MSEAGAMRDTDASRFDAARIASLVQTDVDGGIAALRRAARCGDIDAQALLGQMLHEGRGVVRDESEGLHWFTLAANSGHVAAMNMVGRCHELGRGTRADAALAAAWYRKAARAGLDWGIYNYAQLLGAGRGVKRDRAQALELYRRAAAMGHAKSMNWVGRHYDEGWEVEPDRDVANEWYRRAAEAGDFRGQTSYASVLAAAGRVDEAARWLIRATRTATPAFLERLADDLARSTHASFNAIAARIRAELKNRAA